MHKVFKQIKESDSQHKLADLYLEFILERSIFFVIYAFLVIVNYVYCTSNSAASC